MRHNDRSSSGLRTLTLMVLMLLNTQCVEEFNPDTDASDPLIVINGSILQGSEVQTVTVSRSTSVRYPTFIPVEGCMVNVIDDRSNVFQFEEQAPGIYTARIDPGYLQIGVKFKLTVETPGRQVYESGLEEMYDSPSIDSLYFIQETNTSDQQYLNEQGVRLNVDVYARDEFEGYYRWKIHETWESRSSNAKIDKMLTGVLDSFITTYKWDTLNSELLRDRAIPIPEFYDFTMPDTFHICYREGEINDLYFSSTSNIVSNAKKRVPLHFVPVGTKLSFRYSCLVSQYSLSEEAYTYWQTKVNEITESGGLYSTQPSQNLTNITNTQNEGETVIGYFWVSARKERRVFYKGPYYGNAGCVSERFDIDDFYEQDPDSAFGVFRRIDSTYFPVYITNGNTSQPSCFDCRFSGGTLKKPDYW
jgi:hypothetical protein